MDSDGKLGAVEVSAEVARLRQRLEAEPDLPEQSDCPEATSVEAPGPGFLNREVDITDPEALAEVLRPPPGFDPEAISPDFVAKHLQEEEGDRRLREEAADTRAMLCMSPEELAALDGAFLERAAEAASVAAATARDGGEQATKSDARERGGDLRDEPDSGSLRGFGQLDAALAAAPRRPAESEPAPSIPPPPPPPPLPPLQQQQADRSAPAAAARELSEEEVRAILNARARNSEGWSGGGGSEETVPWATPPGAEEGDPGSGSGDDADDTDDWLQRFKEISGGD